MSEAPNKPELDAEHQALGHMLLTPGWDFFKHMLGDQARAWNEQLLSPSQNRKDTTPDDFLRGCIHGMRVALMWPDKEMDRAAADLLARASEEPPVEPPLVGGSRPPYDEEEAAHE